MSVFDVIFGAGTFASINGVTYSGRSVTINNGQVIVDGVVQGELSGYQVTVNITGNVDKVSTTSGDINIVGDVRHAITTSGDIDCNHVIGDVETVSGDVDCGDIAGRVSTISGNIRQR